jgi:peptide/nickel transport system permease protein
MRLLSYIGRRLIFVGPQLVGILLVSFLLVKLIPGDPAVLMLGPFATEEGLQQLRAELGLDRSMPAQFLIYLGKVLRGDPATLELITLSLLVALAIGMPLGVAGARNKRGILRKVADYYGLLAGALPDFWFALVLIFIFYTILGIVPAPLGRMDFTVIAPPAITGSLLIDSLVAGNWAALRNAAGHLILPVLTLGIVNAGPILKMTQSTTERMLEADFSRYAEMCGLLSWGGAGQYAVQGVLNADLNPVLGFVLYSAILSLIIYLVVDLLYFALDPRTR